MVILSEAKDLVVEVLVVEGEIPLFARNDKFEMSLAIFVSMTNTFGLSFCTLPNDTPKIKWQLEGTL